MCVICSDFPKEKQEKVKNKMKRKYVHEECIAGLKSDLEKATKMITDLQAHRRLTLQLMAYQMSFLMYVAVKNKWAIFGGTAPTTIREAEVQAKAWVNTMIEAASSDQEDTADAS